MSSASLLRLLLRALVGVQPDLPEPARSAVERAVSLRLGPAAAADEKAIDALRAHLASRTDTVEVVDYGAGADREPVRRVSDVYAAAASGPLWGRAMTGLVRGLRPRRVLELGTNLGVSAAHIALALRRTEAETDDEDDEPVAGRLVTLDGAPALAEIARRNLGALGHTVGDGEARVRIVVGAFDETLADVCAREGPFDLVFVDGHHERDAALRYVETIRPHVAPGGVVVLDDVEPTRPVRAAYRALRREGLPGVWLGKWGVLVIPDLAIPDLAIPGAEGAAPAAARPTTTDR